MVGFHMANINPWKPNAFGLALDAIGLGLFGFGIYRLLFPL